MNASRSLLGGVAQVGPVNVRAQVFAADCPAGFALNGDSDGFADLLTDTDGLPEIPNRGVAAGAKVGLLYRAKAVEVGA